MNSVKEYWMVHNTSGSSKHPTYMHNTEGGAIDEAMRIAKLQAGDILVVLKVVRAYQVKAPEPVEIRVAPRNEIEEAF